jgi:malonyl-CoA/methylmalonyl-CoA synthetase
VTADAASSTLAEHFAAVPAERPFDVVSGTTYGDMRERSARLVAALWARGVRPGDRVAAQVGKRLDTIALYLACVSSGVVFVPVNPAWSPAEVAAIDADPAVILDDAGLDALVLESVALEPWHGAVPRPHDLAVVLYTSGTTGRPKGAMLTQGNIAGNVEVLVPWWDLRADDVLLHALPVFHAHGLFVALGCAVRAGMAMVLLPAFDVDDVVAWLPRCTVMMGVPTFYVRLLGDPRFDTTACASMRRFISGSAPMLPATHAEFAARTGHVVVERYGMTETVMLTSNPIDAPRPGSVGLPLPGVTVRVVEPGDDGVGEVQVQGPNVMAGYWARERGDEWDGEWFRTGDLGRIDDDGYLWLTGRSKDLIITGGLNVSPMEVEQVLDALPGVAESAVIGVPDSDFGEVVVAVVVGDVGADDVRVAARERLAGYKAPKRVIVVDELPRNAMGKVEKAVLRARYGAPL